MKAPDRLTNEPNKATPSTLPVCRVALSTPAAMPERDFSTLPSNVGDDDAKRGSDGIERGVDDGDVELNHAVTETHRCERQRLRQF